MDDDAAGLAHPVDPRDRLVLRRGLPLRLHQDDDRGRLDVEADSSGFDLRKMDGVPLEDRVEEGEDDDLLSRLAVVGQELGTHSSTSIFSGSSWRTSSWLRRR